MSDKPEDTQKQDDLEDRLVKLLSNRSDLLVDMIKKMSVFNLAINGMIAKETITKTDLYSLLDMSADAIDEGVEKYNEGMPEVESINAIIKSKKEANEP